MTNFERWKNKITPKQVAKTFHQSRFPDPCEICPAYEHCSAFEDGFEGHTCYQEFLEWSKRRDKGGKA